MVFFCDELRSSRVMSGSRGELRMRVLSHTARLPSCLPSRTTPRSTLSSSHRPATSSSLVAHSTVIETSSVANSVESVLRFFVIRYIINNEFVVSSHTARLLSRLPSRTKLRPTLTPPIKFTCRTQHGRHVVIHHVIGRDGLPRDPLHPLRYVARRSQLCETYRNVSILRNLLWLRKNVQD